MNDFPRADISELLSLDILHKLIKGTFKDDIDRWYVILDNSDLYFTDLCI